MRRCAYCGCTNPETRDHPIPRGLYADLAHGAQLVTVPCCEACNKSWQDDEAHFRTVVAVAGDIGPAVEHVWTAKIARSFEKEDGARRRRDLHALIARAKQPGERDRIYPDRDDRVLRVVRKMVRGLSHHHDLRSGVRDEEVMALVLRFPIAPAFEPEVRAHGAVPSVAYYGYLNPSDDIARDFESCWVLTFYERTRFIAFVNPQADRSAPPQ